MNIIWANYISNIILSAYLILGILIAIVISKSEKKDEKGLYGLMNSRDADLYIYAFCSLFWFPAAIFGAIDEGKKKKAKKVKR